MAKTSSADSRRLSWEIRRRVNGSDTWHPFISMPGDLWHGEVSRILEAVRKYDRILMANTELKAFEVWSNEVVREW